MKSKAKQDLIAQDLEKFSVTAATAPAILEQNRYSKLKLEIGFGDGTHLVSRGLTDKETLFIGCEVYANGIAQTIKAIKDNEINNILIFNGDARKLCAILPNHSLHTVYILFPDPWHKRKHHKRRLLNIDFIRLLQSKLLLGTGCILVATDHQDYAAHIHKMLLNNALDYSQMKPSDWIGTKYEEKSKKKGAAVKFFSIYNDNQSS